MTLGGNRPIICLVSDGQRVTKADDERYIRFLVGAARAGVDLIQIRERGLDDRRLLSLVRATVAGIASTSARVIVNERVDVALAGGAAGVHLRADSLPADRVRRIVPPGFLIGRSVHQVDEARRAAESGIDYTILGTIYPTASKTGATRWLGVDAVERAVRTGTVPLLGIGGVTADTVGSLAAAGAAGFAAIGLFADLQKEFADDALDAALRTLVSGLRRAFRAEAAR
jgi:thiamine-phosphate pyrophosphorylase